MQQIPLATKMEHILFDLRCCMNELRQLEKTVSVEVLDEITTFIAEYGNLGSALLGGHYSIKEAESLLTNHYYGPYHNEVDFAYAFFEDHYGNAIPENIMCYFDYIAFTRDLFKNDYFSVEANGKMHVFAKP